MTSPSPTGPMAGVRPSGDSAAGSAVLEAFVLPGLPPATTAVAAVRVSGDGRLSLVGPSLFGLVLGCTLCLLAVRSGLVRPERLVSPRRGGLANANGVVALLALLLAAGQVFTLLMPESGLMALLFGVFYLALLSQAATARPDGPRLLRSLLVLFGTGLLLRFALLNGAAAPDGSLARRLFASALDGLTLGGLGLEHHAPATGLRGVRRAAALRGGPGPPARRALGVAPVRGRRRGTWQRSAGSGPTP